MTNYALNLIQHAHKGVVDNAVSRLMARPGIQNDNSLQGHANKYVPSEELESAINVSIAIGEPLLITGEPGTGKTQAAYYVAEKLGLGEVLHFQVKSDSIASDLLYHYDAIGYMRDVYIHNQNTQEAAPPKISDSIEKRALWQAYTSDSTKVVLIDEIDKAPRDFPNDLLHELSQSEFYIKETDQKIKASAEKKPIVIITSNSERHLPEPFLRRCVFHNIRFCDETLSKIIEAHAESFSYLDASFLTFAVERFLALREMALRKKPTTSELLVWLRVLSIAKKDGTTLQLGDNIDHTPYLYLLLKDADDMAMALNLAE